jgi:hypothetical protein
MKNALQQEVYSGWECALCMPVKTKQKDAKAAQSSYKIMPVLQVSQQEDLDCQMAEEASYEAALTKTGSEERMKR